MQTYPTGYAQSHRMAEHIFRDILPQRGMAVREEQIALCHEILDTLYNKEISLCEAGVGIGKTLAYLVACVLWQMNRPDRLKLPVVISTSSVALQDVIINDYLPNLSAILLEERIIQVPLTAVIRKGKERFVCDARLIERESQIPAIRKRQRNSLHMAERTLDMDHIPELSRFDRNHICVPQSCPRDCILHESCCIYSGYLADAAQAKLVQQAFALWPRAFKVVDPVLGDGGRLYSGLGADMVPAMYDLCSHADLIVPNVTEAALLLGDPLPGVGSAEQAAAQAARLTRIAPQVVVTGVAGLGGGRYIGCVGASRGGEGYAVKTPLQPRMFHGTGDIFASVLVGRILQGNVPQAAVQAAAAFVAECIRQTPEGADERLGVWLETALPKLRQE